MKKDNYKLEQVKIDIDFDHMKCPKPGHLSDIIKMATADLNKQFEDAVTEGLRRKGFKFETRVELEDFVKQHCCSADDVRLKQTTYYVNDIPFFLHNYKIWHICFFVTFNINFFLCVETAK